MIESKFVEVTNRDVKDIGINWASLQNYRIGVGGLEEQVNRVVDNGRTGSDDFSSTRDNTTGTTTSNTRDTTSLTGNTSGTNSQSTVGNDVSVSGGLATSTSTSSNATSITNATNSNSSVSDANNVADTAVNTISDVTTSLTSLISGDSTSRLSSAVFSASDFNIILSALQAQNQTKLVSNPTVVTLNNTEASINIGEEFPIPSYTYNAERGTFEVSGFEYRPIGIILKVTPQVNAQGFIKLTIEPEVSSRSGSTTFGGAGGATIPIIATRKSSTQVSLRDGFTMGIGGLIENTTLNGETRVPLLGSIPGLGRLFRSDSVDETKRNLLIFITAKTVAADGAPVEEVFDPRAIRDMGLKRDDLPGYREPGYDPFEPRESADR